MTDRRVVSPSPPLFIHNNLLAALALLLALFLASTGALAFHAPRIFQELSIRGKSSSSSHHSQKDYPLLSFGRDKVVLSSWLKGAFKVLGLNLEEEKSKSSHHESHTKKKSKYGTVLRTAAKEYDKLSSVPSSKKYTTQKESKTHILLRPEGVEGDYNHYRTVALKSTPDRAVSILTSDILPMLHRAGWDKVKDGDLGENLYVDGIDYTFFEVGKRYRFQNHFGNDDHKEDGEDKGVVVEITERIEPCGNLCKLPYINDESLPPRDRLERCKKFLLYLDEKEGLRGWYGKVVGDGGMVKVGDRVVAAV